LLGYGMAGRSFHSPFLASTPGLRLSAIATGSVTSNAATQAAHDHPDVRLSTPHDVITASDIDLIVIATPNDSHAELSLQALDAGKAVVVDKPMACSLADAQRMVERAAQRRRPLFVFHNRRWDDDFLTLRQVMSEGRLGDWSGFESHFDRFRPAIPNRWRERPGGGTGIWWDLGPHMVDQALQLFGPPERVTADFAMQRIGAVVPDYAHVILHYGQRRAILHMSCLDCDPGFRFKLTATGGAFVTRGLDPQEAWLRYGQVELSTPQRQGELTLVQDGSNDMHRVPLRPGDYGAFYRGVQASLAAGGPPPVTHEEALAVMAVLEAAVLDAAVSNATTRAPRADRRSSV
jgi:predicted dehydrogenase